MFRNSMLRSTCASLWTVLAWGALVGSLFGQPSLHFERVSDSLASPVFVTHAPGDFDRLFVVQRGGQIRIIDLANDTLVSTDFLAVPGIAAGGEQGLLGLAFHPNYANNGYFYVNFTDNSGGDTRVVRFNVTGNPDVADPSSGVLLLEIDQPQSNHNGGWIGFGADGYLYIATGDGGGSNDTGTGHTSGTGNAQDLTSNLLGKMLRIDVDRDDFPADPALNYGIPADNPFVGVAGDDEIYLYGLRNPWRCSFDRETWDLYIGDVGQGAREEISLRRWNAVGNRNFGWRLREGMIATPASGIGGDPPAGNVNPIYDYVRSGSGFAGTCVTGGYAYRGPVADLRGHYFFADFGSDALWSFKFDQSPEASFDGANYNARRDWTSVLTTTTGTLDNIASFGEDAAGNLYVCDISGELYRLIGGALSTAVAVESIVPIHGSLANVGLTELSNSDDVYLGCSPPVRRIQQSSEPQVWLELTGTAPHNFPQELRLDVEANATSAELTQTIELFNFSTGDYDLLDARTSTTQDQQVMVDPDGSGAEYVDEDGTVRARVGWLAPPVPTRRFKWRVRVDQIVWRFVE